MGHVVIVGAGFTGMAAAIELLNRGHQVTLLEMDSEPGGLAGSFWVGPQRLEKFYHHWFMSDVYITDFVRRIGQEDQIVPRETRTGMYYAHRFFKLSTPRDVLTFKPLSFFNRLRLGYGTLAARRVKDWKYLEEETAVEYLQKHFGKQVYQVVWEPLMTGKFGVFTNRISAVWIWNKLKLRGSTRSKQGVEMLAYYKGGFAALADRAVEHIVNNGGAVRLGVPATGLRVENAVATGVDTPAGTVQADAVLITTPLATTANLLEPHTAPEYAAKLRRIKYLANMCLVLELTHSLSSVYWLNINDPSFPFIAVIEHTNFEPTSSYEGRHIVYLSKYLPDTDPMYRASDQEVTRIGLDALQSMFPDFDAKWLITSHVWRADFAQPIVEKQYSSLMPRVTTPLANVYISTMAQVYPEDRGTNYAVRNGIEVAGTIAKDLARALEAM